MYIHYIYINIVIQWIHADGYLKRVLVGFFYLISCTSALFLPKSTPNKYNDIDFSFDEVCAENRYTEAFCKKVYIY